MLFPSKVIPYNESILPKLPLVLHYLEHGPKKISDVYRYTRDSVTDISDLFEVLDCLYALGKIDLNGDNLLMIGKEEAE
jgi:hypothetical protein